MIGESVVVLVYLLAIFQISQACSQKEDLYTKVEPGIFPVMSTPLSTKTATSDAFCGIECLSTLSCKSFIFKLDTNSDNCLLSDTTQQLEDNTNVVIYHTTRESCATITCYNGGTCVDVCGASSRCDCPVHYEGEYCETVIDLCGEVDWSISMGESGTSWCSFNQAVVALYRGASEGLDGIDKAVCCLAPQEMYSDSSEDLTVVDWLSFGGNAWFECPPGFNLIGFQRYGTSQEISQIYQGHCAAPDSNLVSEHYDCVIEPVAGKFDVAHSSVSCSRLESYVVGIRTVDTCTTLQCIVDLKCCKIRPASV